MIRLFNKSETDFNHNEHILQPLKCEVIEEENGQFELEFESLLNNKIEVGSIIKVPSPRGEQLFRVYKLTHTLRKTTGKARHVFYDLLSNFIEDTRPTNANGAGALNGILGGTLYPHRFEGISTVSNISTAYYIRKNPVQAILGQGNSLIGRWGGYIKRDNFTIRHIPKGQDKGYEIRFGKNLQGIQEEMDDSKVITKILPTWIEDNIIHELPEKYLDSPLIDNYPFPKVAELRIEVAESITDKASYVRQEALKYFSEHDIDKPLVNYKIDFISLKKIDGYKNFAWTEELDLYDEVNIIVPSISLNLKANVIKYTYNCVTERFEQIEIGNFSNSLAKNTSTLIKEIDNKIEVKASELEAKQKESTDKLTGVTGGNVVIRRTADGKPYEILIMDKPDMSTAKEVVRINKNGIGFSHNGVNGIYSVAITIDGHIVADFIDSGVMTADIMKSGILADLKGKFFLNLVTGAMNIGNKITYDPSTNEFKIDGALLVEMIKGTHLKLSGKNISLDGDTQVLGSFSVSGSSIFGTVDAETINVKNINASNLNRGTVGRPYDYGDFINNDTRMKIDGTGVAFTSDSSYINIRDTGGRGEVMINGTVAAHGSGYFIEINSGGLKLDRAESAGIQLRRSGVAQIIGNLAIGNKLLVLNTDNTVTWRAD